jgi:hypothetical protein
LERKPRDAGWGVNILISLYGTFLTLLTMEESTRSIVVPYLRALTLARSIGSRRLEEWQPLEISIAENRDR